jgi:uncharacterized protein YhaN
MKLLNLRLKAVGPFTDLTLDFSRGDHGLHVVLGPNEAGKSSSLRAISYLLFGFPHTVPDNFLHNYDQLRIGASLRRSDGETLEIVRRKAGRNDLRGDDDASIVSSERLAAFLGGIDRDSFQHRFGIDHARLRLAGEEIRTGKGHLGELLFAAGAGLAGLRQVQEKLQAQASELFKPRGQNQRINLALSGLREARAEEKTHRLSADEWKAHADALKAAEDHAFDLAARLDTIRKERSRLDRMRPAIPLVARRRRLIEDQRHHEDAPLLRDDFGKELRAAIESRLLAQQAITKAVEAIDELNSQLERDQPSETVLAAAEEIEAIQRRLGAVEKAARDRVERDQHRKDKEYRARQILQELGWPADLEGASSLLIRGDESKAIRTLSQRRAQPLGQLEVARAAIARHDDTIAESTRTLDGLPLPPDVSELRRAVRNAQKAGDLDDRFDKARSELTKASKKLEQAIRQLDGRDRSRAELETLDVPRQEALDHFEARFRAIEERRKRLDEAAEKAMETIRSLEAEIRTIDGTGDVPLEADLDAARARRDLGWRLVRDTWLGSSVDPELRASFIGEDDSWTGLAEAFEAGVVRADQLADRLRRESANVARKAGWLSEIRKYHEERIDLERELAKLEGEQAGLDADWAAVIGFLENPARRSIAEVRAWLRDRQEILRLAEKVDEARDSFEAIESARVDALRAIRVRMGESETPSPGPLDRLSEAIDRAESLIQDAESLVKCRDSLVSAIETAKTERAAALRDHEAANTQLEQWRTEWGPRMERIRLAADAGPQEAEDTLQRIDELRQVLHEISGFAARIKGIDRDEELFQADVDALNDRVGMADPEGSAGDRARSLSRLLNEHRAASVRRENLLTQLRQEQERLAEARRDQDASGAILERLRRESGCDDLDQLVAVEERSRSRAQVEKEVRSCEEQLAALSGGADLEAFAVEVESLDPDELTVAIGRLADQARALQDEIDEVNRTIGEERGALARMNGLDVRAVEASENAQTFLAQLQRDVARYAAIRLSSAVLRRAVERYREKSQGPVISRASRLFADLTLGSFSGLLVDEDDDGRMILKGVRSDGTQIGVEGMSDGSHDQLYLALRLASLETWLESNEPIPFIVDDILMSFDDQRATAALRALAELSKRTQVLFFTHHQRLTELAEGELSPEEVFIQELPRRS